MLQQTTVTAVVPYYVRFLQRFPDVGALATADQQDVLKLWEGLGYYSRARNLHRAAQVIVAQHQGQFPDTVDRLLELPGIGRYTAGAIASFAFQQSAPIVEANTLRLYCRLLGYDGDPKSRAGQELLWRFAEELLPRKEAGHINQALMELGALVCTPVEPACDQCPVQKLCQARRDGTQSQIPRPAVRPTVTLLAEDVLAIRDQHAWLLFQRSSEERWAGLWDFPRLPRESHLTTKPPAPGKTRRGAQPDAAGLIEAALESRYGLQIQLGSQFLSFEHSVTRYRIHLTCHLARLRGEWRSPGTERTFRWMTIQELESAPLSMPARRIAQALQKESRGLFGEDWS